MGRVDKGRNFTKLTFSILYFRKQEKLAFLFYGPSKLLKTTYLGVSELLIGSVF